VAGCSILALHSPHGPFPEGLKSGLGLFRFKGSGAAIFKAHLIHAASLGE